MYHNPVLLNECIEGMAIRPNGICVDVTFGGGGHSKKILEVLKDGKLFAFDTAAIRSIIAGCSKSIDIAHLEHDGQS